MSGIVACHCNSLFGYAFLSISFSFLLLFSFPLPSSSSILPCSSSVPSFVIASEETCPRALKVFAQTTQLTQPGPEHQNNDSRSDIIVPCGSGDVIAISLESDANGAVAVDSIDTFISQTHCLGPQALAYDDIHQVFYVACFVDGIIMFSNRTGVVVPVANSSKCSGAQSVVYERAHDAVYAACSYDDVIRIVNNSVSSLVNSSMCASPYALYLDESKRILYASCFAGDVLRIDLVDDSISTVATSLQCPGATELYYHHSADQQMTNDGALFVACEDSDYGGIVSVRGSTVSWIADVSQCLSPSALSYDEQLHVLFAACAAGVIAIADGGSFLVDSSPLLSLVPIPSSQCSHASSVFFGGNPFGLYASCSNGVVLVPSPSYLISFILSSSSCPNPLSTYYVEALKTFYVACSSAGVIRFHDGIVSTVIDSSLCPYPQSVCYDEREDALYAACYAGDIVRLINGTLSSLTNNSQCSFPTGVMCGHSDGLDTSNYMFAVCSTGDVLNLVNGTVSVLTTNENCRGPRSVAYDKKHDAVYVACSYDGVIRIQGTTVTTVATRSQCLNPRAVYYDDRSQTVFAGCYDKSHGGVIRVRNGTVMMLVNSSQCLNPESLLYITSSDTLYAACSGGSVIAISPIGQVSIVLSSDMFPFSMHLSYDEISDTIFIAANAGIIGVSSKSCFYGFMFSFSGICQKCPIGFSGSSSLLSSPSLGRCFACSPGTFSSVTGSLTCVRAAAGSWSPAQSSFTQYCASGSVGYGASTTDLCDGPCPEGYVCLSGVPHPQKCGLSSLYCPTGSFTVRRVGEGNYSIGGNDDSTRTDTRPCQPGTYCSAGVNVSCALGTYSERAAATTCVKCKQGSYAQALGSSVCTLCDAGTYAQTDGLTTCFPCQPGSYANVSGLSSCSSCPRGTRSLSRTHSSSCIQCDPGSYTDGHVLTDVCILCTAGTYALGNASTHCESCLRIDGVTCETGGVTIEAGYWGYTYYEHDDKDDNDAHDTEIAVSSGKLMLATLPCSTSLCLRGKLGGQCAPGRLQSTENVLCGRCMDGWSDWNQQCIDCSNGPRVWLIVLLMAVCWLFVLFIHVTSQSENNSALLGTLFYFVQTSLLICGPSASWLQWLSVFNFAPENGLSSTCPFYITEQQRMILALAMPAVFFVNLGVVMCVHVCVYTLSDRVHLLNFSLPRIPSFQFVSYLRTCVSLLLLIYSQVCTTILHYLHCVDTGTHTDDSYNNGDNTAVFINPVVSCKHDSVYGVCYPIMIVLMIVIVTGVPVVILFVCARYYKYIKQEREREKIEKRERERGLIHRESDSIELRKSDCDGDDMYGYKFARDEECEVEPEGKRQNICLFILGVIFEPYRTSVLWWHVVILVRRLACVILDTMIVTHLQWKMFFFTFIHLSSLLLDGYVRPFVSNIDNNVHYVTMAMIVVLSAMLTANPPPYTESVQICICIIVMVTTTALAIVWTSTKTNMLRTMMKRINCC